MYMIKSDYKFGVKNNNKSTRSFAVNIPLLLLIFLIPLQNIYLGKFPNFGAGINFLNVMTLFAFLVWMLNKDFREPTPSSLSGPLKLFIFIYIFSLFNGFITLGNFGDRHIERLKDILIAIFLYFIVLNSVRDKRGIIIVFIATLLPLPYMFHVFRTQILSVLKWHYSDQFRISGTFMDLGSNEIAAFYAGFSLVLIAIFIYSKNNVARAILGILISMNLYCLLYSYSRGSWLSFCLGMAILLFFTNRKLFIILAVLIPILWGGLVTFIPVSVQERMNTIFVEKEEDRYASALSRFALWDEAMKEFSKRPIIGIGFHTFHHLNPIGGKDTHNYYVKLLTEQGIIGLTIFLVIIVRAAKTSLNLYKKTSDKLYKAIGVGTLAMLGAFTLGNMFGDRMSHYPLSAYFWVYLALAQRAFILSTKNNVTHE
jgi:putative inorganic carbon (HCO3(-)) transporter